VKQWELDDYKTNQTMSHISALSAMNQWEYDCAEDSARLLASTLFSENMGKGKVLWSGSDAQKWQLVLCWSGGITRMDIKICLQAPKARESKRDERK